MTTPIQNAVMMLMGNPKGSSSPVAGYRAWYNPSTIQQSAGVVTAWNDASANSFHFATAVNSPVYISSAINGLAGVSVAAASTQKLTGTATLGNLVSTAAYTAYYVFKATSFNGSGGASLANMSAVFQDSNGEFGCGTSNLASAGYGAGHFDGADKSAFNNPGQSSNITVIMEHYYDGTNIHIRFNGTNLGAVAASSIGLTTGTLVAGVSQLGNYFSGSMCEMIFYNTTLSGANMTANRSYLGTKYAGTG